VDPVTGAPLPVPFLPAIKNSNASANERRDKAVTPIMKKRAAAAAIAEAEERLREEGGSPGSAQLTHKAKRIARKQAKEARKAEAKRRILGGGGVDGGMGGAGAEGPIVEAYPVSEDEQRDMESGDEQGGGEGGMRIMHATLAVPDIAELQPLPMPPIQPAELTDQVHLSSRSQQRDLQPIPEQSSESAPSPPPPAGAEGRSANNWGSKKEEGRGEGSVKLPPI